MDHLHKREYLKSGQGVCAAIDTAANIMLMTDANYERYLRGQSFEYYGGFYKHSPVVIPAPRSGFFNLVLDFGGYSGTIKHSFSIVNI